MDVAICLDWDDEHGLGASSRLMAKAYPRSRITGFDYHRESIGANRRRQRPAEPEPRGQGVLRILDVPPNSLSQDVGLALGAQAGEKRIRDVVSAAGFTRFRRIAENPFNSIYEV